MSQADLYQKQSSCAIPGTKTCSIEQLHQTIPVVVVVAVAVVVAIVIIKTDFLRLRLRQR